ncbi:MAG: hypothetical protein KDA75_18305, partial [Planctomycetaceae bacterium]|nr:hypothetical protein [Planctomycetaceae bacterium]
MLRARSVLPAVLTLTLFVSGVAIFRGPASADDAKKTDPALDRARRQVQMLDDLYKSAIVLITENYVTETSDLAAGDAFQALFKVMKDKGYHEVRLLDATGNPYDDDNSPRDEFEKQAIKAMKSGQPGYEQIIEQDGQRYLRSATPVPVVMKK